MLPVRKIVKILKDAGFEEVKQGATRYAFDLDGLKQCVFRKRKARRTFTASLFDQIVESQVSSRHSKTGNIYHQTMVLNHAKFS